MKERKNVTYTYMQINTKDLCVDELYQRDVDPRKIARIVKNYDPCLVNPIKVSFRDNKYYVFDGRHTSVAEKSVKAKGKNVDVECKVFNGLSRLDEMELFVSQNGESSAVNANDKFRALMNFGDPDVVGMVKAAERAGVRVDFTRGIAHNKVTAIRTLMKLYLQMPTDQFIDMLSVLRQAWAGIPESFGREMLNGMQQFYANYYGDFNSKDLIKSLSKVAPIQIVREGKSLGASTQAATTYARIILRVYNTGRSAKRLADRL